MEATAAKIRKELKSSSPGVKFSIRSKSRKRRSSIDIYWMNGPTEEEVDSITATYRVSGYHSVYTHRYTAEEIEECIRAAQNWYAEHPEVKTRISLLSTLMRIK